MLICRYLLSGLILSAVLSSSANAIQPVIRMTDTCTAPTMPKSGSSKQDWNTYTLLVRDYNECMSAKAAQYGQKTKEAFEGVGETVSDLADTAKGWFKK
jgi:hypothetical protein